MENSYQICTRCIMDTTDSEIVFDSNGVCSHCHAYDKFARPIIEHAHTPLGEQTLNHIINKIKTVGKSKKYDCIIGISGGVDSTFLAYQARQVGLRPLAVHFDSGWNSELAIKNIENILTKLDIDLYTYVVNWEEMKSLQLSFFKASLANCDIPQDHAFLATLYHVANKQNIRYILSGGNVETEFVLPNSWGYNASDLRHLKAIHRRFGTIKLSSYPTLSFWKRYVYYPFIRGIKVVRFLDYTPYNKEKAKKIISKELSWRDYGGKHYESIFTRFFQAQYLPEKFNFDKRKAHFSSLILSGQLSREQALTEMTKSLSSDSYYKEDKEFVAKKLGLNLDDFDKILGSKKKTYKDYPSNEWLFKIKELITSKLS